MGFENNWRKILLTKEDLKRITTKVEKQKVSKSHKYPEGYKEVITYRVDGTKITGGIKQAENELKRRIWEKKQKEAIAADFKKKHGGMFK